MTAIIRITTAVSHMVAFLRKLLDRSNYMLQLVIFYLLSYALIVLYIPLVSVSEAIGGQSSSAGPKSMFAAIFLAPVLETLVNQAFVFWVLNKVNYFRSHPRLIVLLSATIFGALHWYSISYVIFAFILGLLFMCIYMYYLPNYSKAFWSTVLIHFARNLTTLFLMDLFK